MPNAEIKVMPLGHLEFYINMQYPFLDFSSVINDSWYAQRGAREILKADGGSYTWIRSTSTVGKVVVFDRAGNPLMSFDDFVMPPSSTLTGSGELLIAGKKGTLLTWEVM